VEGNVERVMARLHAVAAPLPAGKPALRALAAGYVRAERAGDWPQALMDLGATLCTPRAPACGACPLAPFCAAHARGEAESFPRKAAKPARPERHGVAFLLRRGDTVWTVRRPDKGLLGAMPGLPTTDWRETPWSEAEALTQAPCATSWTRIGAVRHVFTHFALTLGVYTADKCDGVAEEGWLSVGALPTLFRKAALL
jgi:A/G-specific adenine glycosylase